MKEDITQLIKQKLEDGGGCGLVMKEDITQQYRQKHTKHDRCGLVMKEDITQRASVLMPERFVVVW